MLDPSLTPELLMAEVVAGRPPAPDGSVSILPPTGRLNGLLAFAAHHVVVADVTRSWVDARVAPGDMSAPVSAPFLDALAGELGRTYDNLDLVLFARGLAGDPPVDLEEVASTHDHPRAKRARSYRDDVRVWETTDRAGVMIVGRGLGGRWETAFEVDPSARSAGLGRRLAAAARYLVPEGEPLFVQVSPGNVASLKAVLAAGGFVPIGAEVLYPAPAA